jgi:heme/copper-type cytochrome/quinol oxidase subunit 2
VTASDPVLCGLCDSEAFLFHVMRVAFVLSIVLGLDSAAASAQEPAPSRREVAITARDHRFFPNLIEVAQDDLVRVTLTSEGRPYSFAVDAYRIVKRAGAGKTIVFDFRADQPGKFRFYCNLTSDAGCKDMAGTLVVRPR